MSTFSLTKGSAAALGMLTSQAGSETLLLTQPARELRAELSIEPFTGDNGDQLQAVLFMREQRHSMTLQRNDGANVQHLADWVEAVANGTLDTAQAIPQRQPVLLPCCRCEGVAIAYSYLAPAPAQHDLHGVKCRHRDCQSLEGAATAAAAADAWNAIQREELAEAAEPAPAQDEQYPPCDYCGVIPDHHPWHGSGMFNGEDSPHIHACNDCRHLLPASPAQAEQQPFAYADPSDLNRMEKHGHACMTVWRDKQHCVSEPLFLRSAPFAKTIPDGWQLVPMEPTQAMREAFHAATERYEDGYGESPDSQWHAMLRAALATSPTA